MKLFDAGLSVFILWIVFTLATDQDKKEKKAIEIKQATFVGPPAPSVAQELKQIINVWQKELEKQKLKETIE